MRKYNLTFLCAIFLGTLGFHRFVNKKIFTGIIMLLTFGGFGIWWIIDIILIATEKFKVDGEYLKRETSFTKTPVHLASFYLFVPFIMFILITQFCISMFTSVSIILPALYVNKEVGADGFYTGPGSENGSVYYTESPDVDTNQPIVEVVTAEQLLSEYETDSVAADLKYNNQYITVTGYFSRLAPGYTADILFMDPSENLDTFSSIKMYVTSDESHLKEGQAISFTGLFLGLSFGSGEFAQDGIVEVIEN